MIRQSFPASNGERRYGDLAQPDLALNLVTIMNREVESQEFQSRITSGATTESPLIRDYRVPLESVISTPEVKKRPSRIVRKC